MFNLGDRTGVYSRLGELLLAYVHLFVDERMNSAIKIRTLRDYNNRLARDFIDFPFTSIGTVIAGYRGLGLT